MLPNGISNPKVLIELQYMFVLPTYYYAAKNYTYSWCSNISKRYFC